MKNKEKKPAFNTKTALMFGSMALTVPNIQGCGGGGSGGEENPSETTTAQAISGVVKGVGSDITGTGITYGASDKFQKHALIS